MSKQATRDAYGLALVELGKENENIVVLDADLSKSTKTCNFKDAYPERFFNMGIAEQNLEWLINLRTTVAFCNEKIEVFVAITK